MATNKNSPRVTVADAVRASIKARSVPETDNKSERLLSSLDKIRTANSAPDPMTLEYLSTRNVTQLRVIARGQLGISRNNLFNTRKSDLIDIMVACSAEDSNAKLMELARRHGVAYPDRGARDALIHTIFTTIKCGYKAADVSGDALKHPIEKHVTITGRIQTSAPNVSTSPKTEESRAKRFWKWLQSPVRTRDVATMLPQPPKRTLEEIHQELNDNVESFKRLGSVLADAGVLKPAPHPLPMTKSDFVDFDALPPGTLFEGADANGRVEGMVLPTMVTERLGKVTHRYAVVLLHSKGSVSWVRQNGGDLLPMKSINQWACLETICLGNVANGMERGMKFRLATDADEAPYWNPEPKDAPRDRSVGTHDLRDWVHTPMGGTRTPRA